MCGGQIQTRRLYLPNRWNEHLFQKAKQLDRTVPLGGRRLPNGEMGNKGLWLSEFSSELLTASCGVQTLETCLLPSPISHLPFPISSFADQFLFSVEGDSHLVPEGPSRFEAEEF